MSFKLKIDTRNDAFKNMKYEECARILEEVAQGLRNGQRDFILHDLNGNKVGEAKLC